MGEPGGDPTRGGRSGPRGGGMLQTSDRGPAVRVAPHGRKARRKSVAQDRVQFPHAARTSSYTRPRLRTVGPSRRPKHVGAPGSRATKNYVIPPMPILPVRVTLAGHRQPEAGMGTADVQGPLWGAAARDWAEIAEPGQIPFYDAAHDALGITTGTRLLDVGCGAGLALQLAAKRGAAVTGIDAAAGLLAVARERLPEADLRQGDIEELPYDDSSFDAV